MFSLTPFNRRQEGITRKNDLFDIGSMFDGFFSEPFSSLFSAVQPMRADIKETEKEYVIDAEIPGAKKEDIKLDLRDDVLTLSVEHNEQVNEEKDNYIRKERRYGSYSRSFYVEGVKHEGIAASYKDGILNIRLPKAEEPKDNKHRIDIQ